MCAQTHVCSRCSNVAYVQGCESWNRLIKIIHSQHFVLWHNTQVLSLAHTHTIQTGHDVIMQMWEPCYSSIWLLRPWCFCVHLMHSWDYLLCCSEVHFFCLFCDYIWKMWLISAQPHVFQLTLVCRPETPRRCRGETLSLERLTGGWKINKLLFNR